MVVKRITGIVGNYGINTAVQKPFIESGQVNIQIARVTKGKSFLLLYHLRIAVQAGQGNIRRFPGFCAVSG